MDVKQVVVAYDFSESADVALERAVDIACRAPAHVLHFIAAIDARRGIGGVAHTHIDFEYTEKIQTSISDKIRAAFAKRGTTNEPLFFVHARIGKPVKEIMKGSRQCGYGSSRRSAGTRKRGPYVPENTQMNRTTTVVAVTISPACSTWAHSGPERLRDMT